MNEKNPNSTSFEDIMLLNDAQNSLREQRDDALNSLEFEDLARISNEMDDLRNRQIEALVDAIQDLRDPTKQGVIVSTTNTIDSDGAHQKNLPVESYAAEQRRLRDTYSMIFATIWTESHPGIREDVRNQLDHLFRQDSAMNWMVDKIGYIPEFPAESNEAMKRELMDILTAFRVELDQELIPTMAEAMEDPQENLLSMADLLEGLLDPNSGGRD
jgi:hypothetical protein